MRLFGTDGIRAPFGEYPLDRPTVTNLGRHLGDLLQQRSARPIVVLGGDTRASTPELCSWISDGLVSAGAEFVFGGVLPTPAIATLVGQVRADAGVAVSASHNPLPDNGIKIFNHSGFKASNEGEQLLEERLLQDNYHPDLDKAPIHDLTADPALSNAYLRQLEEIALHQEFDLSELTIVIDSGNGAASPFARQLFEGLGARVISIHDSPDGTNINQGCGSTVPELMASAVREQGADLGIAFDGDADRAIFADETGEIRDGDATLYLWARYLNERDNLDPAAIVATSMSNLGLEVALKREGIDVVRCDVGDRTVVSTMLDQDICLGGEQSGHIIHLGFQTTGDGLLTGIQVAGILAQSRQSFSELLSGFRRFPQVLVNVRVSTKPELSTMPAVQAAVESVESELGDQGRLVLRYSGTEPLARVMIEGPDQDSIAALATRITNVIRPEIGSSDA